MMAESGCNGGRGNVLRHEDLGQGRVARATREGAWASRRGHGEGWLGSTVGRGWKGKGRGLGVNDGGRGRDLNEG